MNKLSKIFQSFFFLAGIVIGLLIGCLAGREGSLFFIRLIDGVFIIGYIFFGRWIDRFTQNRYMES